MGIQSVIAVQVTMVPFVILVQKATSVHHQKCAVGHVTVMVTLILMSQAHAMEKQGYA